MSACRERRVQKSRGCWTGKSISKEATKPHLPLLVCYSHLWVKGMTAHRGSMSPPVILRANMCVGTQEECFLRLGTDCETLCPVLEVPQKPHLFQYSGLPADHTWLSVRFSSPSLRAPEAKAKDPAIVVCPRQKAART